MGIEIRQQAPDFELKNQHGETVSLSSYRRERNVLLIFYPFAFSGVCTDELRELRDQLPDFRDDSTEVLAISCDPMFALRAFADKEGYSFPLLSDFWPHGAVASAYQIFNAERGCAGRSTVLVDREGAVRWTVDNEMPQARNLEDVRKVLAELR